MTDGDRRSRDQPHQFQVVDGVVQPLRGSLFWTTRILCAEPSGSDNLLIASGLLAKCLLHTLEARGDVVRKVERDGEAKKLAQSFSDSPLCAVP